MTNDETETIRSAVRSARAAARREDAKLTIAIGVDAAGAPVLDLDVGRLRLPARCIGSALRTIADAYEDEAAIVRHERRPR
jgi:hypothetical protein